MTSAFIRERRRKDGSVRYVVLVKVKVGARWRMRVVASQLTDRREAERIRRKHAKQQQLRRAGMVEETPTVAETLDAYEQALAGRPGLDTVERVGRLHIRPALGDVELGDLTRPMVQELADGLRAKGLGPQSLRHVVGTLRAAINHALRKGAWGGFNVADKAALPRLNKKAHDTLTLAEASAVLAEVPEVFRPFAAVAIYAGLRPGELVGLRVEDVDLARRLITVRHSHERDTPKDGDERRVPIAAALLPYLHTALEHARRGRVFPAERGAAKAVDRKTTRMLRAAMVRAAARGCSTLVTGWTMRCRRCGTATESATLATGARCGVCKMLLWPVGHARKVRWYDLRHTAATLLIESGAPPALVAEILGHSDVGFTMKTYVHLRPDALLAAVDRVVLPEADFGAPVVPLKQKARK